MGINLQKIKIRLDESFILSSISRTPSSLFHLTLTIKEFSPTWVDSPPVIKSFKAPVIAFDSGSIDIPFSDRSSVLAMVYASTRDACE